MHRHLIGDDRCLELGEEPCFDICEPETFESRPSSVGDEA